MQHINDSACLNILDFTLEQRGLRISIALIGTGEDTPEND